MKARRRGLGCQRLQFAQCSCKRRRKGRSVLPISVNKTQTRTIWIHAQKLCIPRRSSVNRKEGKEEMHCWDEPCFSMSKRHASRRCKGREARPGHGKSTLRPVRTHPARGPAPRGPSPATATLPSSHSSPRGVRRKSRQTSRRPVSGPATALREHLLHSRQSRVLGMHTERVLACSVCLSEARRWRCRAAPSQLASSAESTEASSPAVGALQARRGCQTQAEARICHTHALSLLPEDPATTSPGASSFLASSPLELFPVRSADSVRT